MDTPSFDAAIRELDAMRKAERARDLSGYIQSLISQTSLPDDLFSLRSELINELHCHGRNSEAAAALREDVNRESTEPYHSLRLAEHFHYYDVDLPRSLRLVAEAIAKAKADGKFLYQALGVQARLAIEVQDWSLLEATLDELSSYEHTLGNVDVFPEIDFLKRIPTGVVSAAVLDAYVCRVDHLRSIGYSTTHGVREASA